VARHGGRATDGAQAVRSGVLWGCVFGLYLATQALAYASSYKTVSQRARLAKEFGSNAGISALVGPAHELQTVAGFTVWKCLAVLAVVGAAWGLLTGTRLLRGEEDAGRWELLLAGQTTRRSATAQALVGLACGVAALWAVTAVITVVVGRSSKVGISAGRAVPRCGCRAAAAMFLTVGAFASQLAATRRQASAYAGAALGVSYALRMVADSAPASAGSDGHHHSVGSSSSSPSRHLSHSRSCRSPGSLQCWAFSQCVWREPRDLGASTFPDRASSVAHTRLVFGPSGLNIRLMRSTIAGWGTGIAATGWCSARRQVAGSAILSSSSLTRAFLTPRAIGADAYLGVAFLLMAVLVAFVAAGRSAPLGLKRPRDGSTTSSSDRSPAPRGSPGGSWSQPSLFLRVD